MALANLVSIVLSVFVCGGGGGGYQLGKAEKEMSYSKNYVVFLGIP